ncbi:MAG: hypothetical protein IIU81_06020 [Peptococcaceae bacterium]|nr:hypothetical protein [Peptococcaceae bacterium]
MRTKDFVEKLEQDAKENNLVIMEKIQAVGKNPEAVYAIAQEVGVTDSFEVFQAEMTKMYENMSMELTDEELLAVAGGELTSEEKIGMAIGIPVGVGLSAATAAAL